ncbi:TolC family protein [Blastopirellula marina]|uniref:TolC family protein n=1 Tax=Blastopirellula marina TaxID=124 RepID=A0A2S8G9T8_9BACT|nr:TolC family protein [Blastopirellula marina]PQO41031.1 hypothetical protein C5Y98_03445 [Blastopirellula marina]PTL45907.1 TolC family protein [Blastopirellula marina]
MYVRKQGCDDIIARLGRFAVFVLSCAMLLAGCHHSEVRDLPQIRPLQLVPQNATPAQAGSTAVAAKVVTGPSFPQSDSTKSERPWPGRQPQATNYSPITQANAMESESPSSVVSAAAFDDAPVLPAKEPEVLPFPERLTPEPQTSAASPADALHLALPSAVAQGLMENPDLVTLRGQLPVNEAMVDVANTPIWNPFVQTQILPRGKPFDPGTGSGSGSGKANYYVWVMQRFEVAHQRRYRTESALAALNQVQWNIMQAELMNVSQTARLYFTALYQKELYELATESADLSEHLLEVQQRRFQANLALARDVTTAEIAARQSRRQAAVAKIAYEAALVPLRQQLNIPVSEPVVLSDRLGDLRWHPLHSHEQAGDALYAAELVEGRPDVMAAQVGIQVARANLSLARAAMVPDIQAGPIYDTSDAGTQFLGLRLQMDLPVWNSGRPLANQRHMEVHQQALTYEQLKIKAGLEAQTAMSQYNQVREMASQFKPVGEDTPPELTEIMRLFEAGQADILAVLATQNDLLQERRTYLDVLNQLALSAANVIQATALPLEHVVESPGQSSDSTDHSIRKDEPIDG